VWPVVVLGDQAEEALILNYDQEAVGVLVGDSLTSLLRLLYFVVC
jgi:hypothetical protein